MKTDGVNRSAEEKRIRAQFDEENIRVYQAYGHTISDEALRLGTFGAHFQMDRMTWIKPSFLWMMYRSGWATKVGQERILAIDMKRTGFNILLENVVWNVNTISDRFLSNTCLKTEIPAFEPL